MATSFTEYRGLGIHCRDGTLQLWLASLVDELDAGATNEAWLRALREEWYAHATVGFDGHVEARLDDLVATEERRSALLALCRRARARLASRMPERGSLARRVGPSFWEGENATARILRVADAFVWLLDADDDSSR